MRIGLDFDGVITHTVPAMIAYASHQLGLDLTPRDCIAERGPAGLDATAFRALINATHATDFALGMEPTAGAAAAVRAIASEHEVVVVTAREGRALEYAVEWIERNEMRAAIQEFVSSDGRGKGTVARELALHVLVDDIPGNLREVLSPVVPVLWSADYNRDAEVASAVQRVNGWDEFIALVRHCAAPSSAL